MREIKFRAWHKEQKKMYFAEEMGRDQLTLMPDGRGFANISGKDTRLSQIDDGRRMIPLQYTGLKDKNGKEIYEGDILRSHSTLTLAITVDETHSYRFMWGKDLLCKADSIYGEVIGNIHENPELLAKGENAT